MERLIMNDLLKWKNKPSRKPLLFTGVRQCGKTYILKEFGSRYFEDVAYFNFEENETIASLFEYDLNVKRILDELGSVVREKPITPGKTLVIFDEVQKSGRAVTSLKYFCENMPELHLIAAGSLLGVALKRDEVSYPVGKTDELQMYPMTFEEFVKFILNDINSNEDLKDRVEENKDSIEKLKYFTYKDEIYKERSSKEI